MCTWFFTHFCCSLFLLDKWWHSVRWHTLLFIWVHIFLILRPFKEQIDIIIDFRTKRWHLIFPHSCKSDFMTHFRRNQCCTAGRATIDSYWKHYGRLYACACCYICLWETCWVSMLLSTSVHLHDLNSCRFTPGNCYKHILLTQRRLCHFGS